MSWINHFVSDLDVDILGPKQVVMMNIGTLLIIQSSMAITIIADASDCVEIKQDRVLHGWTCQPFDHQDITNVPYHHCTLTCIQHEECQAFIYDKVVQLCMLLSNPCVLTQPAGGHIYGISKPQCVSWEHHDEDYPFYWYYEGPHKSYVGRRLHRGDMLVGKVINGFYTVDPNDFSHILGGSYENLVVDTSCEVTWVYHDANSGQSLPTDALIGGVLAATNSPLYVARQLHGVNHMGGYYNPIENQAWSPHWIRGPVVLKSSMFEVMTVMHPWQCRLDN